MEKTTEANLFEGVLNHWPIAVVIVSIIFSWAHFQSNLAELARNIIEAQNRITTVEASSQTASVNYATLSGKIETANGKLDILLKANHLQ